MTGPHYVESRFYVDPRTKRRRENRKAVCGRVDFDLSDVQSLIKCDDCRSWIRKHESDKHRLKLVENAWKGKAAKKAFWNQRDGRWDV